MRVSFVTPNRISLINLTTIGDSEKRDDDTKIGQFSSGQAYATALLLRSGVMMDISIYGGVKSHELSEYHSRDEGYMELITYTTAEEYCESTGKSKEVIQLNYSKFYSGCLGSAETFHDPSEPEDLTINTAFALQLGYNWELWMALRELWSNMSDEGGYIVEGYTEIEHGTVIALEFEETNSFYEVWQNKHLYINENPPLYEINSSINVLENKEEYLRIYKQNILVFEDKKRKSKFAYSIKFGQIDERRILSNLYSVEQEIASAILQTTNEEFLRQIITPDFEVGNSDFLSSVSPYYNVSGLANDIATEVYQNHGSVSSYEWLLNKVKERTDCQIGGKKIRSISDHLYNYSGTTTVKSPPMPHAEPAIETEEGTMVTPFQAEISKHYNFTLDVVVTKAKLGGSKVIADKYNKCIIIDEEFSVENDFPAFLVEYFDLTQEGNVVKNLSKYICKLLEV